MSVVDEEKRPPARFSVHVEIPTTGYEETMEADFGAWMKTSAIAWE